MTDEELPIAQEAIRLAKQGGMPGQKMMEHIVAGKVYVLLFVPPDIVDGRIAGSRPVIVARADGS